MVQLAELQKIENILDGGTKPKGRVTYASLEAKRTRLERRVEVRALRYYRRIREKYDDAVVPVIGGYCPACHVRIPAVVQQEIRRGVGFHYCGSCGRILMWE